MESDLLKLWKVLENTDQIIGFNSDHFDIPLLNKYYPGDLRKIKSIDLMKSVVNSFGRRLPLDAIAAGTLGKQKSGHGLQAITWWKQGEIEKIRKYCEDDVRITREIYEYALANKSLKYKIGLEAGTIPIDTSGWEERHEHKINYTLPF
jgi:DEAD/DEAH box helicase domain-containing protein